MGFRTSAKGTRCAYKGDGDQSESSGSVEVTVKDWQDQIDGVSDKLRTGVRKTVRFVGTRRIPEEKVGVELLANLQSEVVEAWEVMPTLEDQQMVSR